MRMLSQLIMWLSSWKIVGDAPKEKKFIMIAAPHTSNWDFLYARSAFYILRIPMRYTIKSELFFFPLGAILKAMGGISIDRNQKGNMVDKMVDIYKGEDQMSILITPEGTRSHSPEWKKGFYYIALKAKIPIYLGYLDYSKKHAGIGPRILPSGDYEKDLKEIQDFYRGIVAKYPKDGVH